PFLSNLKFDTKNLREGDLEISSEKKAIETSYQNLWYVNYFSLDNITKSGKLNDRLIEKEINYGKEGKKNFIYQTVKKKKIFSQKEFSASFSTALNYFEIKNYLTETS